MTAHVIDGKRYARDLRAALSREVVDLAAEGSRPGLATVVAGTSYPAHAYERRVRSLAEKLGLYYVAEAVHPVNTGLVELGRPRFVPSTPASAFHLLDRYLIESGRDPGEVYARSNVVVVGRSANVGKPAITLATERGATVVSCDVNSHRCGLLYEHTRNADILVVATGVPGLIAGEHVKRGVIAVDVGINPVPDPGTGKVRLVGDLDFDSVADRAEAITPVPGGVGPITDVWLLRNTIEAARLANGLARTRPLTEGLSLATADEQLTFGTVR